MNELHRVKRNDIDSYRFPLIGTDSELYMCSVHKNHVFIWQADVYESSPKSWFFETTETKLRQFLSSTGEHQRIDSEQMTLITNHRDWPNDPVVTVIPKGFCSPRMYWRIPKAYFK